jgi:replicative DNA helicase
VILSPAITDTFSEPVPSHAFTDLRLADIYTATLAVYHRSPETAGDPSALVAELTARGDLVRVGGAVEVFNLVSEGATAHALSWHGARITDAARLRALEAAAIRIQHAATSTTPSDDEGTAEVIRYAWQQLEDATSAIPARTVMLMEVVFDAWRNRSESTSVPIGLELFNRVTSLKGAHQGHLILVAARPATGKSTVLAQSAVAAANSGAGVLFVTLEMVGEEVLERCMANQLATSVRALREDGVASLPQGLQNITLVDTATSVTDIAAIVRQSRRTRNPIELVLVDYLQLLTPPSRTSENRQTEVAAISRALKRLAVDERVAVIAASQLNRASENRADKRPSLADLRESGQLEADADVVMLLHRDPSEPFEIEFIIAKKWHGAIGSFAGEPNFERATIMETQGSMSKAV